MDHLFELSHFFEFLCSAYFGFTILVFIENHLISAFLVPFKEKIKDIEGIRSIIGDFKQIVKTHSIEKMTFMVFFVIKMMPKRIASLDELFFKILSKQKSTIENWSTENGKHIILKMFFPTFLIAGVYCILTLLLSAFQCNNPDPICYKAIEFFYLDLTLATLVAQPLTYYIIPRKVGKINYLTLMAILFSVGFVIFITIVILGVEDYAFYLNRFVNDRYFQNLELLAIIVALFPLLAIFYSLLKRLFLYQIIVYFYDRMERNFSPILNKTSDDDIGGLKRDVV